MSLKQYLRKIKKRFFKKNENYLDIHITEHCNLNCKSCAHFSPIAEKKFIDLNKLTQTYTNLCKYYNKFFDSIHLLGGEPLLHPQIIKILNLTRSFFPRKKIEIVTNGILLTKMPEKFWQTCYNNNISIYVSQYSKIIDYSKMIQIIERYKVKYHLSSPINEFRNYYLNINAQNSDKDINYKQCKYGGQCMQLKDNKIYPCYTAAYIEHVNKYFNTNFEQQKEDYIELNHVITKKEFKKIRKKAIPFCKYCDMKNAKDVKWAISKKSSNKWIK